MLQWDRALLINTLMRPRMVVVVDVGSQHAMKMSLAEDQDLVQALLADRANPALREGCSGPQILDRF